MGCSLLSIVEIFFFSVAKLFQLIKTKLNKKVSPEIALKAEEETQIFKDIQKFMVECKIDMNDVKEKIKQQSREIKKTRNEIETVSNLSEIYCE